MEVTLLPSSGSFEVLEDDECLAHGRIKVADPDHAPIPDQSEISLLSMDQSDSVLLDLNQADVYRELRVRGYYYGYSFQGITKTTHHITDALMGATENWVVFLDYFIQIDILNNSRCVLDLPISVRKITIHPQLQKGDNAKTGMFLNVFDQYLINM